MTEEQILYFTIGKVVTIVGLSFVVGWAIVSLAEVMSNASTVLADKAKRIRQGKD